MYFFNTGFGWDFALSVWPRQIGFKGSLSATSTIQEKDKWIINVIKYVGIQRICVYYKHVHGGWWNDA